MQSSGIQTQFLPKEIHESFMAVDIGGTNTKIAWFCERDKFIASILHQASFYFQKQKERTKQANSTEDQKLERAETVAISPNQMIVYLRTFQNASELFSFLKFPEMRPYLATMTIKATGGGSVKYAEQLKQFQLLSQISEPNEKLQSLNQFDSLMAGVEYLSNFQNTESDKQPEQLKLGQWNQIIINKNQQNQNLSRKHKNYSLATIQPFEYLKCEQQLKESQFKEPKESNSYLCPVFPLIVANIGSGLSIIKISEQKDCKNTPQQDENNKINDINDIKPKHLKQQRIGGSGMSGAYLLGVQKLVAGNAAQPGDIDQIYLKSVKSGSKQITSSEARFSESQNNNDNIQNSQSFCSHQQSHTETTILPLSIQSQILQGTCGSILESVLLYSSIHKINTILLAGGICTFSAVKDVFLNYLRKPVTQRRFPNKKILFSPLAAYFSVIGLLPLKQLL